MLCLSINISVLFIKIGLQFSFVLQTTADKFTDGPQCEGGNTCPPNLLNNDHFNQFNRIPLELQCELTDLERNITPFKGDMTDETMKSLTKDIWQSGTSDILPSSPGSQVERLTMDVSKDNIAFNSHTDCSNLTSQVVPGAEVVKQQQSKKKELELSRPGMHVGVYIQLVATSLLTL